MKYRGKRTRKISFPLGGIGTGSIGLAGNGSLIDWEIFNRPNKNSYNGYSHFAIKVVSAGKTYAKVLTGDTSEDLTGVHDSHNPYVGVGFGPQWISMAGFPHFKKTEFDGSFPLARVAYRENGFPVSVKLVAFNPFIPHDDFNSSLPAAFFEWEIENLTDGEIECALAFSVQNPALCSYNHSFESDDIKGIFLEHRGVAKDEIGYFDLCAVTDSEDVSKEAFWYRGRWMDACTTFWKNFLSDERLGERNYTEAGKRDHGTLASYVKISPRGKKKIRFVLAWNVPNQYNYWNPYKDEDGRDVTWKNYYATEFENSRATAEYAIRNFSELYRKTKLFSDTLQKSTLPPYVKDAVSANLSVLKSPTVLRLEDGSLWGWEGCAETDGSCEGSCQHVWNYAYALPFLFPKLERSLRENNIKYALREDGSTCFRIPLPIGRPVSSHRACVDGQMGEVIKCYREWKISGDDSFIKRHAEDIFKMLEFAWSPENPDRWDLNMDGVLEGRQHHTLDMELFGPSSWLEGFYLLALDCGAEIAEALGEPDRAKIYRELYEKGKRWMNENLFNGEYFYHKVDLEDKSITESFDAPEYWNDEAGEIKYQVADGCLIDQMLADWHATLIGCNAVFEKDKKHEALRNLFKYNYKPSMREVTNMWRLFAINDEGGALMCTYPNGAMLPTIPISYCEECMTGFEYALAGLLISSGFVEEGETVVKSIRDRYDGEKRNPWNEIECGANYARSMASYALLPIYSGFSFDMREKCLGFAPVSNSGRYLWSVGDSFGEVKITDKGVALSVFGNPLTLKSYKTHARSCASLTVDGEALDFREVGEKIIFSETVIKRKLEVKLK